MHLITESLAGGLRVVMFDAWFNMGAASRFRRLLGSEIRVIIKAGSWGEVCCHCVCIIIVFMRYLNNSKYEICGCPCVFVCFRETVSFRFTLNDPVVIYDRGIPAAGHWLNTGKPSTKL